MSIKSGVLFQWDSDHILNALGSCVESHYVSDSLCIREFSTDTTTLQQNDAYIARRGDAHDGYTFIPDALKKGASLIIAEKNKDASFGDVPYIIVDDATKALCCLASYARSQSTARIIAISGSVGKTTAKEMLAHALSTFGHVVASRASYNNHIGVPLSMTRLNEQANFGIFEVGMNHRGEIGPLSVLINPHCAVITRIAEAHIGSMGSLENIAEEKSDLFRGLVTDGVAIMNHDSPCYEVMHQRAAGYKQINAGSYLDDDAFCVSSPIIADTTRVTARIYGVDVVYTLNTVAPHMVELSLLVLLAVASLDLDYVRAAKALDSFHMPAGRAMTTEVMINTECHITLIDDAYNANPTSMRAGLNVLQRYPKTGRKIAILGDMLELGDESHRYHTDIATVLESIHVDSVFCCGPLMKLLYDALPNGIKRFYAETPVDMIPLVLAEIENNDCVLVKGSKGSKVSKIAEALRDQSRKVA
jgi:UDP-N-acetylmuramoyl-tripeptide--D-alanyl-D-alanine ligase